MKEDQHTEFKRIWKDEYIQYISGFANAQGGTLYIGIDDDGQVCGINNATKLLADLPNQINQTTGVLAQLDLPEPGFENFMSGTLVTIHRDLNIYGNITEQTGNVTKIVTGNVTKKHINNTNTDDYTSIGSVTKNVTKTITKTSNGKVTKQVTIVLNGYALMVVEMIERNPKVTTAQMAETIGIAKKNLIALTNNLQRDGIIRRVGSNRGGHWEIIDNNQ